jgi:hypothetical protein
MQSSLLSSIVPWGRTFDEYQRMFRLGASDLRKRIVGFGDGPASFNAEMRRQGLLMLSIDPLYAHSKPEIAARIEEARREVMAQVRAQQDHFIWSAAIRNPDMLEQLRMQAMSAFLRDFEAGKEEGRYLPLALPQRLPFDDQAFDLGLSSHFLLLYEGLGPDFHRQALEEMLRVCREVRLFPTCNLEGQPSGLVPGLIQHFSPQYQCLTVEVPYEFQKGANEMLVIRK